MTCGIFSASQGTARASASDSKYRGRRVLSSAVEILSRRFHPSRNNELEGKIYEKAFLNCIGGKWTVFCPRAEF
jgi:hypothetical protein